MTYSYTIMKDNHNEFIMKIGWKMQLSSIFYTIVLADI